MTATTPGTTNAPGTANAAPHAARPSPLRRIDSTFTPGAYRPPACRVAAPAGRAIEGMVEQANCLWVAVGRLPAGTTLEWDEAHGEQALYLVSGELVLDGRACGPGGALMIEAGVPARAAVSADAHVLHLGSEGLEPPATGPLGAPAREGRAARVIAREEAEQSISTSKDGTTFVLDYLADGSGETSRIALFTVTMDGPSFGAPHHHSEDELIYVLSGTVRSGTVAVEAGQFFAVPGNIRYSFRTPGPASFLNFRRDASTITVKHITRLETLAARARENAWE